MAMICRTSDGDVLDAICFHYYGHLSGMVEAVLGANPGLAVEPQPYRAGVLITLPELARTDQLTVQLWD